MKISIFASMNGGRREFTREKLLWDLPKEELLELYRVNAIYSHAHYPCDLEALEKVVLERMR